MPDLRRAVSGQWGTPSSVKYEDPVYKFPVALRAFGNYAARVQDAAAFFADTMRRINRIADVGAEAHAARSAGLSYAELQRLEALRDAARNDGGAGLGMGMAVGLGAAANVGAGADDSAAKLQRLKDLFDQGLISQTDYDTKRAEILAPLLDLQSGPSPWPSPSGIGDRIGSFPLSRLRERAGVRASLA